MAAKLVEILSSRSARCDNGKLRLFTGPRWVRPDGKTWRPIEQVVKTAHDPGTGAYRVTCGGDWITWTPRLRPAGLFKRAVVEPRHFGDILDGAKVAARAMTLQYDVAFSAGVQSVAGGWRFHGITDVPVGLFLSDLVGRLGPERVRFSLGRVSLDLDGVPADENGEINLDPIITATGQSGRVHGSSSTSWALAREGGGVVASPGAAINCVIGHNTGPTYIFVNRGFLTFETSGYRVSAATLYLCVKNTAQGGSFTINKIPDYGTLTTDDFGVSPGVAIVTEQVANLPAVDDWYSVPVAAGLIEIAGDTCMLGREAHDVAAGGDPPGEDEQYGASFYGASDAGQEPYLELELITLPAGSLAVMGAGR